jgi:hypothetical protein
MTCTAAAARRSPAAWISAWIGRRQQEMSDRAHASGDKFAAEQGWTVTTSTGRFGFGARTCRDPRFDQPRRNHD